MKKRKGVSNMVNTIKRENLVIKNSERYCSVSNSLKSSLNEINEYKNGKRKLKTWNEYLNGVQKE